MKWVLHGLLAIASIGLLSFLIDQNWEAARPGQGAPVEHLRWVVLTRTEIERGQMLTKNDLRMTLGRRADVAGDRYVATSALAAGRFATRSIPAGTAVTESLVSDGVGVEVNSGSAIVPVEVATDHIAALVPGMMLAFANDKEMVPAAKDLAKPKADPAFTLLAIAPSPREGKTTSLVMMVPACRLPLAARIGAGAWRPIILGPVPPSPRTSHGQSEKE